MNCLHIDPNKFVCKIDPKLRDFNYTFLEILKEHEIPSEIYYSYLLSIEEFKLKNIWNILVNRWNIMDTELNKEKIYLNSNYPFRYSKDHKNIDDEILNERLNKFIENDILKGLFLCNIIQSFIVLK